MNNLETTPARDAAINALHAAGFFRPDDSFAAPDACLG